MAEDVRSTDDESIKPVSSLRSRFESLGVHSTPSKTAAKPPPLRAPTPERHLPGASPSSTCPTSPLASHGDAGRDPEISVAPQPAAIREAGTAAENRKKAPPPPTPQPRRQQPGTPRQRPVSMLPASPSQAPPRIDITSPKSPAARSVAKKIPPPPPATRRSASPSPDRQAAAKTENSQGTKDSLGSLTLASKSFDSLVLPTENAASSAAVDAVKQKQAPPPPVKRSAKTGTSTPSISNAASPLIRPANVSTPSQSPHTQASRTSHARTGSAHVLREHSGSRHSPFGSATPVLKPTTPSPVDLAHSSRPPPIPSPSTRPAKMQANDVDELRPALPPRRDMATRESSLDDAAQKSHTRETSNARSTALDMGFSRAAPGHAKAFSSTAASSVTSSPRSISPIRHAAAHIRSSTPAAMHSRREKAPQAGLAGAASPDASRINRRVPYCSNGARSIPLGFDARLVDVCGGLICAAGPVVRVWDSTSGRLMLSMSMGEQVRATAVSFKPFRKSSSEGSALWIGTDWGELMEIDILSKRVVKSNTSAHSRREILRILRHGAELWTMDDEGKLWTWPLDPDDDQGCSDLDRGVQNARVARRPSATLVVQDTLWVAAGKEVRVYEPTSNPDKAATLHTQTPITQPGAGDILCAAAVPGEASAHVYLGHTDGKISVYSSEAPFDCIALLAVGVSRIYCMLGVGDYLWVALGSGNIHVFDPSCSPWEIKKEWQASTGPVLRMVVDPNSVWKIDSLQIVSLGADADVCMWDGLLQADWLDDYMHVQQTQFCTYRSVSAMVLTWNAGAVKPSELKYSQKDARFFQELLKPDQTPDILVFGLQELVDLEDKKLTVKTLLLGQHKDAYGQEHLSAAYRAWRDYLTWCLDECTTASDGYTLLHTASLVGLFTCIFVKGHLRQRIRSLSAAEVKTGMGGLHGNKGALVVRFVLDDSSLCFVNCHLAAGQSHTNNRNNDVTTILESESLPTLRLGTSQAEILTSGGDGSMILDHEMCILNGDLNYRIDTMPRESVISAVRSGNLKKLLERDQLLLQRRKSPGFRLRAFNEAPIDFAPTYKYDVGSDEYDTGEKRRVPAWCDRILWRGDHDTMQQQNYRRHDGMRASDHRPVSSSFRLKVKTIDAGARTRTWHAGEDEFAARKTTVAHDSKLAYLRDYFGMTTEEAASTLHH